MTLSRAGESSPQVLNPSSASGSAPPFCSMKFLAEKNSRSPIGSPGCEDLRQVVKISSKRHATGYSVYVAFIVPMQPEGMAPGLESGSERNSSHCHRDQVTCLRLKLACLPDVQSANAPAIELVALALYSAAKSGPNARTVEDVCPTPVAGDLPNLSAAQAPIFLSRAIVRLISTVALHRLRG